MRSEVLRVMAVACSAAGCRWCWRGAGREGSSDSQEVLAPGERLPSSSEFKTLSGLSAHAPAEALRTS